MNNIAETIPSCVIIPDESDFLVKYARKATKGMIELGSAEGRSSVILGQIAQKKRIPLICVDRWDEYPFEVWKENVRKSGSLDATLHLQMSTQDASENSMVGGVVEFDFLFIDADHTYEGVKADFENYLPLLSLPATVVFHDVNHGGAKKYFDEIKDNYKHEVSDNIGAIYVD